MGSRRGPGEGSIFKRKDRDLWCALVTVGHDKTGKRIRKPVYGKTKTECLKKKRKLESEVEAGTAAIFAGTMTVESLISRWIREVCEKKLKRSTVSSYRGIANNHIIPAIGRVKLSALTPSHVSAVILEMESKELAGSTRKHAYTILNASLKWAVKMDLLGKNPCDKIEPPKPEQTEQDLYTVDEILKLLNAAAGHRLETAIVLAVCTGARQGEIFGLRWDDVDLEAGCISIRRKVIEVDGQVFVEEPKTKKSRRQVTLPTMAVESLIDHRRRALAEGMAGSPWVFPSKTGEPMRRQSFNRWAYNPIVTKAGLRHVPFKNLRHSHATALLSSGEHPKVVQERLGHSRISTTMDTYSHVTPTMQAEAARRIDDLLSGAG